MQAQGGSSGGDGGSGGGGGGGEGEEGGRPADAASGNLPTAHERFTVFVVTASPSAAREVCALVLLWVY
jgi:hypothetical protein